VDPRRTAGMAEQEEMAQEYFEVLKDTLRGESPRWWKKNFKHAITEFIAERLEQKETRLMVPCEDEEEEEQERIYLHALRRFVAGAFQEWELAQQPEHAAMCAKLEGALVWQGRGYVSAILHAIPSLIKSLQSQFEEVSQTLWLVIVGRRQITFTSSYFPPCWLQLAHI
jgi:hypothetical protein